MSAFTVLHVCMGNICRSPMAERLLAHAVRARVGPRADELLRSESAGTGSWHVGEPMNGQAATELRRRGVADEGFRARQLLAEHVEEADLVLTATGEQLRHVKGLRPDAAARAFVLGEFGRLARAVDTAALPASDGTPEGVQARGVALVAAAHAARAGAGPRPSDDLDDPWGMGAAFFTGTAEEIVGAVESVAAALFPTSGSRTSGAAERVR